MTFLGLLERPRFYHGYINGFKQPSALIKCQVNGFNPSDLQSWHQALNQFFEGYHASFDLPASEQALVECTGKIICSLHQLCGMPVFQESKIEIISLEEKLFHLWIPCFNEYYFHQIMAYTMQFLMQYASPEMIKQKRNLQEEMHQLIANAKNEILPGVNSLNFLAAANREEIPWRVLAKNNIQYGWGCHSRWMQSTLTDQTSRISTDLTNDKIGTSVLLQRMGLPVPEQKIARTEDQAISIVNAMGYPVVIKPCNQERGRGVSPNLLTEAQVKRAFHKAREFSEVIIVEKHIIGKDYRLLVLNGKLIWAIERIPPSVTGDGIHSLQELIDSKKIKMNADIAETLADSGHDLQAIPASGKMILLNRLANISSGATPVAAFDKVHPDNKQLMETIAKTLRLDIAGIDFITRDIQHSFHETGGAIIEVNASPQLGLITAAHVYPQILHELLPERGRIPVMVVCGQVIEEFFISQLKNSLPYKNIGLVKENGAYLNDEFITQAQTAYSAAEILLLNEKMDALIYCIHSWDDIADQGLPFDAYDQLFYQQELTSRNDATRKMENVLRSTLLDACRAEMSEDAKFAT